MTQFERIDEAAIHLGSGAQYSTPDKIDKTLLVGVTRFEKNVSFVGFDVWNAYEFSCLLDNGYPVVAQMKLICSVESPRIVESKSLKLYLNSFNMVKLGATIDQALVAAKKIIEDDLLKIIGLPVSVTLATGKYFDRRAVIDSPMSGLWIDLEQLISAETVVINTAEDVTSFLESPETNQEYTYQVKSSVLRSNCRVTHQPDWGDVYIRIEAKRKLSYEGLLNYLVSFRTQNHFHEEICETIFTDINKALTPESLLVACLYVRRGGIDINPVRALCEAEIKNYANNLVDPSNFVSKLWRQ